MFMTTNQEKKNYITYKHFEDTCLAVKKKCSFDIFESSKTSKTYLSRHLCLVPDLFLFHVLDL